MARALINGDTAWKRDMPPMLLLACAAGAFYVVPWAPIYLPCFLALAALTLWRLDLALVLIPAFAPYFMQPKALGSRHFAPSEIFLVLDVCAAFILLLLKRGPDPAWSRLWRSPFLLPASLFGAAVTVSVLAAADRHQALQTYRLCVLDPLAFFALLLLYVRGRRGPWYIFGGLLAGGLSAGIIALVQFVLHRDLSHVPGTRIDRVKALYGSPDNLGLLLDRVVPAWFALALGAARGMWRGVVMWALGVVLLIPLALTFSLGAWLGVIAGSLFVLSLMRRWGRWTVIAAVLAGAAAVGLESHGLARAFRAGHTNSTQQRLYIWQSSLHMIRDHPLLGVGPDNFLHFYAPPRPMNRWQHECKPGLGYINPAAGAEPCLSHPHDEFLDFWLSSGLFGLAAYLWLQIVFWRSALVAWKRESLSMSGMLVIGCMGAMLASLVHGFVDNSYWLVDLSLLFWLLCGLVSILSTEAVDIRMREHPEEDAELARPAGIVGAAAPGRSRT